MSFFLKSPLSYSSSCPVVLSFLIRNMLRYPPAALRLTPLCVPFLILAKAQSSGKFSSEELLSLKREFQHHKDKIHEYNLLMDTVSRTEGELLDTTALLLRSCVAAAQVLSCLPHVRRWWCIRPHSSVLHHGLVTLHQAVSFKLTHTAVPCFRSATGGRG